MIHIQTNTHTHEYIEILPHKYKWNPLKALYYTSTSILPYVNLHFPFIRVNVRALYPILFANNKNFHFFFLLFYP